MRTLMKAVLSVCLLLGFCFRQPSLASQITNQEWKFDEPPPDFRDIRPEVTDNPGATLDAPPSGSPSFARGPYLGRSGLLVLLPGAFLLFKVPNVLDASRSKVLTFEIIYRSFENPPADPLTQPIVVLGGGDEFTLIGDARDDLEMGWKRYTAAFYDPLCPEDETLILPNPLVPGFNLIVDRAVIHTECVPEPSSFILLGLGTLLGMAGRFHRRRY